MRFALAVLLFSLWPVASAFDPVVPGRTLVFPNDMGAHPGHRIEWWYVTGHLDPPSTSSGQASTGAGQASTGAGQASTGSGRTVGFQLTFFRVRNPEAEGNPSRFAPRQLLFAHAAIADPAEGRLLHGQRSARLLEGLVEARQGDTHVRLDDWSLVREAGRYSARVGTDEFTLELTLTPTRPVMLQGERGFSRKGASGAHASYYYSEPQLKVAGRVVARGVSRDVAGVAWLDHEWSSELLAADALGWDWLGANLDDGSALMAFRIRGKDGGVLWTGSTLHGPSPRPAPKAEGDAVFQPIRTWKSPRTAVSYPVAMEVRAGGRTWRVEPLMDDQELDARASTGTLYWEGAVRVTSTDGMRGRGYLELTGYGERVPF